MLQLTFNPGLTLTGFRTTQPRISCEHFFSLFSASRTRAKQRGITHSLLAAPIATACSQSDNYSHPKLCFLWKNVDDSYVCGQALRPANAVTLSSVDIAQTLEDLLTICHLSFRPLEFSTIASLTELVVAAGIEVKWLYFLCFDSFSL